MKSVIGKVEASVVASVDSQSANETDDASSTNVTAREGSGMSTGGGDS